MFILRYIHLQKLWGWTSWLRDCRTNDCHRGASWAISKTEYEGFEGNFSRWGLSYGQDGHKSMRANGLCADRLMQYWRSVHHVMVPRTYLGWSADSRTLSIVLVYCYHYLFVCVIRSSTLLRCSAGAASQSRSLPLLFWEIVERRQRKEIPEGWWLELGAFSVRLSRAGFVWKYTC